ncbi:MAG: alpha-L-arabinofuranosidase C-terminal domain-containing protein [Protaetiibacter sp.]
MITSRMSIDPGVVVAPVSPRLFGTLVEHMGRCVYGGVFDPGDANADATGIRLDVARLAREAGVGVVRYPGGNFVSGYDWQEGVGPERTPRLDLAWRSIEPNTFGLHEFMDWMDRVGAEPMLAANLGTRGVAEAVELVEYANLPGGTRFADLRRANGREEPYGVRLWCLGNEMDGPWQIGHRSAAEYGSDAAQAARAMKLVDPAIELVVCGSSHDRMPTFGEWERTVLEQAYDDVDYISLHRYYEKTGDDRVGYLASGLGMDAFIDTVVGICDEVGAARGSDKKIRLSFDEWNVEIRVQDPEHGWEFAPRLSEDVHSLEDAVVIGGLLISLLRHADRVAVACFAQLVNVMALIRTEPGVAWTQPSFFPFALTAQHARGEVLQVAATADRLVSSPTRGDVEPVDAIATHDPADGAIAVFAVNRGIDEEARLEVVVPAGLRVVEHVVLADENPDAVNTAEDPDRVVPRPSGEHAVDGALLTVTLPAASWTMIRLEP